MDARQLLATGSGLVVILALVGLVAFIVARLAQSAPARITSVIVALTALLGAIPAVLSALHG